MELKIIMFLIIILLPSAIKEHKLKRSQDLNVEENKESNGSNDFLHLYGETIKQMEFVSKKRLLDRKGFATEGVYVFTNNSKGNYRYVGQSIDLIRRVDTHIKGRGNPDIYNDISSGDSFNVSLIRLEDTHFVSLNDLERYLISEYNTYYNGYNKTRGNS